MSTSSPAQRISTGPGDTSSTLTGKTAINALSDEYVVRLIAISPISATQFGVHDRDSELDDLSPEGLAGQDELVTGTLAALAAAESTGRLDDVARDVILERLSVEHDRYRSGWMHADLNVIASPVQAIRMIFDLTPTSTLQQKSAFATRMRAVPAALAGYQDSLRLAASKGQVSAARQVEKCASQCAAFAGSVDQPGFFSTAVNRFQLSGDFADEVADAAHVAEVAYAALGGLLTDHLRPQAPEQDAVGPERYSLASRQFLGATVNLQEGYEWGWQELLSIEAEMHEVAARIAPGLGPKGAAAILDRDPNHLVKGRDGLQAWMQNVSDRALEDLGRNHFDIPEPLRTLECLIAPPGGGVGAHYIPPSDDFSRPGRMWRSVEAGRNDFPTWRETTVVYHEGVPGHHLQLATAVLATDRLNDFQRLLAGTSGHAEGWALYAERLVREIGYLKTEGDLLGMLGWQLFRAARVVVDIGMHLQLPIPAGTGFHDGERWTPAMGLEFLLTRTLTDPALCRDEIDRYLGWPGQAPSYKIGERIWLEGRALARNRHGSSFDEKAFHREALNLGGMGLEPLAVALARL